MPPHRLRQSSRVRGEGVMAEAVQTREARPEIAAKKWVYLFHEGNAQMRDLLGGKGAGLAEMTNAGLPVPPGFTITTEACNAYFQNGERLPDGLWEQTIAALRTVEQDAGKKLGDAANPLLVSVRSGAKFSMPGMMDTVLNLGLNEETRVGLERQTANPRFAWDAYRRFIQIYGRIVMGIEDEKFDHALDALKKRARAKQDTDLKADQLQKLVAEFKKIVRAETKREFPTDVNEQLRLAIEAVFKSWFGRRAHDYREVNKIPHDLGTACCVGTMVFGNMGTDSGTGVAFTRDPNTGEKKVYGEYLLNAQGEDVVAGIRTPKKLDELRQELPDVYEQFLEIAERLEKHYRDAQDLEFTVERRKLYMLQTRSAKRTAKAAVKIAVDMTREGLIDRTEALRRVEPGQVDQLLLPRFDEKAVEKARKEGRYLGKGLNASPGAAMGRAVFEADRAVEWKGKGQVVLLVRPETSPDDFHGMVAAAGILTSRGGSTSHAAVVARGLGLPCVVGMGELDVDLQKRVMKVAGKTLKEGSTISIDGTTGEVFAGALPTMPADFEKETELHQLLAWADESKTLGVWVNADTPGECVRARRFGAEGVGLARTEHMFREAERLPYVQAMILASDEAERRKYLKKLLPFQQKDFREIFEVMHELPVVIRLIDPPLHEFLREIDIRALAKITGLTPAKARTHIA